MITYKKMTALTIVVLLTAFCFAQFSPKKTVHMGGKCQQQAAAATSIAAEAEDFSLINLLTLKFM